MDVLIKIGTTSTEQTENAVLSQLIKTLNITIKDETFISQQKDAERSFTRDRVFTFEVLLSFLMTNLQKGLQREIALFAEAILVRRLSDITEPIRPGRKFKRNHQKKRKHYMNYKLFNRLS